MFVLYIANYLDRVNVSFAAFHMNRDLGFSSAAYGLGAGTFFLGYCLFQIPSNLVLARVGARRWIGGLMITWGLIASAMMLMRGVELLRPARAARGGRGGVLSGDDPLPHVLVPHRRAGPSGRRVHDRDPHLRRGRWAPLRSAAGLERRRGARRVAVAVLARRVALGAARRRRPLVPDGPPGGRSVAARGGTRLARRALGAGAGPRRRTARHELAARPAGRGRLAAGTALLPDHRGSLRAGALAAADHQGVITVERSHRRPALSRARARRHGHDGRRRGALRPHRRAAPSRCRPPRSRRRGLRRDRGDAGYPAPRHRRAFIVGDRLHQRPGAVLDAPDDVPERDRRRRGDRAH